MVGSIIDSFMTDPNQDAVTSLDAIKRRRLLAEKLMEKASDYSPVQSWAQGAARVAQGALGALDSRAADADERKQQAWESDFLSKAANGFGGAPAPAAGASPVAAALGGGSGAMPGGPLPEDRIKAAGEYFLGKGYAPHQVAGIVGNLMQESGLNPGAINKGDGRDGSNSIGMGQWNGPRAQAFQAFAAANKLDPNSPQAQYAFIDHELKTSESGTGQALSAATNPQEAARAFIGYERPRGWKADAPEGGDGYNRRLAYATRAASLLGNGQPPAQTAMGGQTASDAPQPGIPPQQPQTSPQGMVQPPPGGMMGAAAQASAPAQTVPPQMVAQAAQATQGMSVQQMMQAAQRMSPQGAAVMKMLIEKKIQQNDPLRQLQVQEAQGNLRMQPMKEQELALNIQQKRAEMGLQPLKEEQLKLAVAQAAENLKNAPIEREGKALANDKARRDLEGEGARPLSDQERQSFGIAKGQAAYMTRSGEIKFGPAGTQIKNEGSPQPGYKFNRDAEGNVISQEAIPGSPVAQKEKAQKEGEQSNAQSMVGTIDRIERTMKEAWAPTTGMVGEGMSRLPGSAANDIRNNLSTLKANISFDQLNKMRQASPTGGALGAVSDAEGKLLADSVAALEQSQSEKQFKENLGIVKERYLDVIHGKGNRPGTAAPGAAPTQSFRKLWE